ncbi:MAG: SMP-30/gluconolactonase/LRE family protein [Devosia sp.]|uniref:SMP-30/gluconolactonase/LRE family protein n=1 Tax=Devosia sp. 66-22 TaxID=1895753 RepID=UPI00092B8E25|nr:SMP-30/gluconolactonase/LRE family protein [Devosia sp. 66-22]MBN9347442.1 SMP-30/gluconolactonase/LRE family protein [Devosia sp.]OJX47460.1 MAG: gluconolaconase [Devosia sp. 66-22]
MIEIDCVVRAQDELGEATIWDPGSGTFWWVDIFGNAIRNYVPATGETRSWMTPEHVGCIGLRERGGLVAATVSGFHFFDPRTGLMTPIVDPEADVPETRFNDGKTDRFGRFWAASMFEVEGRKAEPVGCLYRLEPDMTVHRVLAGVTSPNGLAWSPDGRIMYFTDSSTHFVWAYDMDPATGMASNKRVFIDLSAHNYVVDGATVDAEGNYWLTVPFGARVLGYSPAGRLIREIELPVDIPTCCEFGGPNLDVLYVTSAVLRRWGKPVRNPDVAGGLFAITGLGVTGLQLPPFAG